MNLSSMHRRLPSTWPGWLRLGVAVSLLTHVLMAAVLRHSPDGGDAPVYLSLAHNLLEHHVFSLDAAPPFQPSAYREPLYPLFLAALTKIFGSHVRMAITIAQASLTTAGVLLLASAVRRLVPSLGPATLLLLCGSPVLAAYSVAYLTEVPATALVAAAFAAPVLAHRLGLGRFLAAGTLLGLAILTRDTLKLLPLFAIGALVIPSVREALGCSRTGVQSALALAMGVALVVLPWTIRNRLSTGEWFLTTKGRMGINLWIGTWETDDSWTTNGGLHANVPQESYDSPQERDRVKAALALEGAARDRAFLVLFGERIRRAPAATLAKWLIRIRYTWTGTRISLFEVTPTWMSRGSAGWYVLKGGLAILNGLVVLLGFAGLVRATVRRSTLIWFGVPILYSLLIYLPFHSTESRYSHPAYPFLLVFAGYLVFARARSASRATTSTQP